jgi:hypothetical protein
MGTGSNGTTLHEDEQIMEKFAKNYALRYYLSIFEIIIGLTIAFFSKYYFINNLIFVIGYCKNNAS